MKRLLIVGILTGIAFLLVQCGKQSTPPDEPEATNSITIETSVTSTSTNAGSSAFWAEYRCLTNGSDSTCEVRFLEIGDADGVLYQVYLDSTDIYSETGPILLSGNGYDLAVTIKSSHGGKDGNSGTGGKRFLTLTIQPMQIPRLPYPPCLSTTSLTQSLVTKPYSLDSVRVSRDDLLAWITYKSGNSAPQFSLVAWYPGVASTGDTTNCYLRFAASDTSGPLVKARLGFNLAPLANVIAQKTPCECVSTLRVLRPQNNWHSGFEAAEFERTVQEDSSNPVDYIMPLADGNYWVYSGYCPSDPTPFSTMEESLSVTQLPSDRCKKVFQLKSSVNRDHPNIVEICGNRIYVDGTLWSPPIPERFFSSSVPAGTFDSCFTVYRLFMFNGIDDITYAKGVGLIRRSQWWVSVRSSDSYRCNSVLLRYRVAHD